MQGSAAAHCVSSQHFASSASTFTFTCCSLQQARSRQESSNNKVDPDDSVISVFHKSVRDWFTNDDKLKDKLDEHERDAFLVKERQGHALLCHAAIRKLYAPRQAGTAIASKSRLPLLPSLHLVVPSWMWIHCHPIDLCPHCLIRIKRQCEACV